MSQVLAITIPIFLIIGIAYFAVRGGLVEQAGLKTMAGFVLNFALPALIIRALAARKLSEVADASYFLVYGGASLLVFAAVFAIARWARGRGQSASAIQALGATAANSGFFGYPIAALVLCGPHRVRHLLVEGRQVVRDGRLTGLDADHLAARARQATARLMG